jgi:glycosyl transferase family 25
MNSISNNHSNATGSAWDFFPLIMCINLRERTDRLEEAKSEFQRVGINRVIFLHSERQPDRDKAIIDSHMACLRYAIEQNVPHVLIFEDDALFTNNYELHLPNVVKFLQNRPDWNLFHLGGFIFRKVERITQHIVRGATLNVHAVVVKTEFAKKILEKRRFCYGMSVDLFYSALNKNNSLFYLDPVICIQRPSESDGTWDKASKNKDGWLGQAMIYTSLRFRDKLRFNHFSYMERFRIHNGIWFFCVYRWLMRKRLLKTEALARNGKFQSIDDNHAPGSFAVVDFPEKVAVPN